MTQNTTTVTGFLTDPHTIKIEKIKTDDIFVALEKGIRDFRSYTRYGLFLAALIALGGWMIILSLVHFDLMYLIYPMLCGFALIAPFIAAGLYEISRRHELGEKVGWRNVFSAIWQGAKGELGVMSIMAFFALAIWVGVAFVLYISIFGIAPKNPVALVGDVLTTPKGWLFLMAGNLFGLFLAAGIFTFTVISFPLLFDKDHEADFITAMITSVRAVSANPLPMMVWAAIIGITLLVSLFTGLILLLVVLPVLGHTTWHVYRRVISHSQPQVPPHPQI